VGLDYSIEHRMNFSVRININVGAYRGGGLGCARESTRRFELLLSSGNGCVCVGSLRSPSHPKLGWVSEPNGGQPENDLRGNVNPGVPETTLLPFQTDCLGSRASGARERGGSQWRRMELRRVALAGWNRVNPLRPVAGGSQSFEQRIYRQQQSSRSFFAKPPERMEGGE